MDNRMFYLEADTITQHQFELIHRYIRKTLEKKNEHLVIRSIPLNNFAILETLIKSLGVH
jgi:hypothetical protein